VNQRAYPTAGIAAERVQSHFLERHQVEQARRTKDLATVPDSAAIEALVDCAFWASLRHEERFPPRVSLGFLSAAQARVPLTFERPLPLTPEVLTRLAPAVERPGIHLGVWRDDNEFYIWGATRTLPALCFVLEVFDPGLLVIKRRRAQETGKFVNVAVLQGDRIKVVDNHALSLSDSPLIVAALLGLDSPPSSVDFVDALIQLSVSMRAHGRGGSVLIVPHGTQAWRESIIGPTQYSVLPPYSELGSLVFQPHEESVQWSEKLRRSVDLIAGLTAVDGAMVLTDRCDVLAFGAKIGRREGYPQIENVIDAEPVEGSDARAVHPSQLGGTRHLSAAQFSQDQIDSVALVASQDGGFTVFAWSAVKNAVHAYRVEALLL